MRQYPRAAYTAAGAGRPHRVHHRGPVPGRHRDPGQIAARSRCRGESVLQNQDSIAMATPFGSYPGDGVRLLCKRAGSTARHEYGLRLQRLTKQTTCAYCGVNLVDDYNHWLLLTVDHVIPATECERLRIPTGWRESYSNIVLCCSGCNSFDNHYRIPWDEPSDEWTLDRFFRLRNRVFQDRKQRILTRRAKEIVFFESQPWAT